MSTTVRISRDPALLARVQEACIEVVRRNPSLSRNEVHRATKAACGIGPSPMMVNRARIACS